MYFNSPSSIGDFASSKYCRLLALLNQIWITATMNSTNKVHTFILVILAGIVPQPLNESLSLFCFFQNNL